MKQFFLALVCAAGVPAVFAAEPTVLRVQPVDIVDRQGFDKPLVAATVMVPAGWRAEGGVQWQINTPCGPAHRTVWAARAPDGSGAMQLLPAEAWTSNNFGAPTAGCPVSQATDARQYLNWFVQRQRPGARVLDYRPRPDLAQPYAALNQTTPIQGASMRAWVDAGELLIAYQANGRALREAISAVGFFIHTRMPGLMNGPEMQTLQGQLLGGFALSAPEGELDFRRADALRASIRPGADWSARMRRSADERFRVQSESNARIGRETLDAIARRGEIATRTRNEIAEMQAGSFRARSDAQDRMQRDNVQTIREVQPYHDPQRGGTVELSSHYQHAWRLKDGSYVLTDKPNFNPNVELGIAGEELRRAR